MAAPEANVAASKPQGLTQRFLDGVERLGNQVPHPVLMFLYLIVLVIVLSHVMYLMGVSVTEQIAEPVADLGLLARGDGREDGRRRG